MTLRDRLTWIHANLNFARSRTLLTALGIAIGVAAVGLLTSIGEGLRGYVMDEFSQFGTRIVSVNPGKALTGGMGGLIGSVRPLSLEDAVSLKRLPHVEFVVPVVQGTGEIEFGQKGRNVTVFGVGPDMPQAWKFAVAQGRFLPDIGDDNRSSPYAVLGYRVREELFTDISPLGQRVRIGGLRFRVIGVIEPKGDMLGFDLDDALYIPADLALSMFDREGLMEINVVFAPTTDSVSMAARIRQTLMARHGREDFTITTQDQMLSSLDSILVVLTISVGLLGGISLLVGAVGILTTLMTSVQERRGEIGLLAALGANRGSILGLFLSEAVTLALIGGIAGILLAVFLVMILGVILPALPLMLHPDFLALALLVSVLIGLLSGAYPAWRAATQDPVEALRSE